MQSSYPFTSPLFLNFFFTSAIATINVNNANENVRYGYKTGECVKARIDTDNVKINSINP